MNQDTLKAWIAALRSGDYKQGTGALNRDGKFCCLGVLCDLAVKANVIIETGISDEGLGYGDHEHPYYAMPPRAVLEWLGHSQAQRAPWLEPLRDAIVHIYERYTPTLTSLADLNDKGATFAQLADALETQVTLVAS